MNFFLTLTPYDVATGRVLCTISDVALDLGSTLCLSLSGRASSSDFEARLGLSYIQFMRHLRHLRH